MSPYDRFIEQTRLNREADRQKDLDRAYERGYSAGFEAGRLEGYNDVARDGL